MCSWPFYCPVALEVESGSTFFGRRPCVFWVFLLEAAALEPPLPHWTGLIQINDVTHTALKSVWNGAYEVPILAAFTLPHIWLVALSSGPVWGKTRCLLREIISQCALQGGIWGVIWKKSKIRPTIYIICMESVESFKVV